MQRRSQVDPDKVAVLADVALLHAVRADIAAHHALKLAQIGFQIVRVGNVLEGLGDQFVAAVSDDVAQPLVDPEPRAVEADVRDADGGVLERAAEPRLAFLKRLLRLLLGGDVVEQGDELAGGQTVNVGIAPAFETIVAVYPGRQVPGPTGSHDVLQRIEQSEFRDAAKGLRQPPADDRLAVNLAEHLASTVEIGKDEIAAIGERLEHRRAALHVLEQAAQARLRIAALLAQRLADEMEKPGRGQHRDEADGQQRHGGPGKAGADFGKVDLGDKAEIQHCNRLVRGEDSHPGVVPADHRARPTFERRPHGLVDHRIGRDR